MSKIYDTDEKKAKLKSSKDRIQKAVMEIFDAYHELCDMVEYPVDPEHLHPDIEEIMAPSYEIVLRREELVKSGQAANWEEASQYI